MFLLFEVFSFWATVNSSLSVPFSFVKRRTIAFIDFLGMFMLSFTRVPLAAQIVVFIRIYQSDTMSYNAEAISLL